MSGQESAPSIENWLEQGQYMEIQGHRIFYRDDDGGQPDTLLLIHGFPTASWDWSRIWHDLVGRYRLVAMDMLGFGYSDKPDNRNYSIHGQADLVEGLVEGLGLGSFHVLAHDYGDTVAQELLARQNAGVGKGAWQSVCFLNGGLFPETHLALPTQKLLLSPLGPLVNRLSGRGTFGRAFSKVFGAATKPSAEEIDAFWALVNYKQGKHLFHNLITYMSDRREHRERWVAALDESGMAIALINGSVDPVSGAHMVARYRELGCRLDFLEELAEIGHYPQFEDPAAVSRAWLAFMEVVGAKAEENAGDN